MMNTTPNQHNAKSVYINPYACKAHFQQLRRITVEEPIKPYADFQQLKMAKVNSAKVDHSKSANQKPGIANPIKTNKVMERSTQVFWRTAERVPRKMEMEKIIQIPKRLIIRVIGSDSCINPLVTLPDLSVRSHKTGF